MKPQQPSPRGSRFNRFQTSVPGLTWVPTSMDAHFDPTLEPPPQPGRSTEQMERVDRVEIPAVK